MSTSDSIEYKLFEGAAITTFPSRFRNASYTRRVPDNQVVFVDSNRDESLVFEVNELNMDVSDEDSAKYFLDVLKKKLYGDNANMYIKPEDIKHNYPLKNPIDPCYVSTAVGTVDIYKRRPGGNQVKNLVKVYLANIRLKDLRYKTDVIITAYEPVFMNMRGLKYDNFGGKMGRFKDFTVYDIPELLNKSDIKYGPSGGEMEQIFKDAVYNFKVTDWSFFTEKDY